MPDVRIAASSGDAEENPVGRIVTSGIAMHVVMSGWPENGDGEYITKTDIDEIFAS